VGRGRTLGTHAEQIGAYAAVLQPMGRRLPVHVARKPIKLGQLSIAYGRRHAHRILFAATRRRDAALVHADLAHLAPIALVDASLEEFGAVAARGRGVERIDLHFVVGTSAAGRFQAFP